MFDNLEKWEHPGNYMGDDMSEYFIVYSRNPSEGTVVESNFEFIKSELSGFKGYFLGRFSHWACGWVEVIFMHETDINGLEKADGIMSDCKNYPILDEDDYNNRRGEAINQDWNNLSLEEKINVCKDNHESIFAARRDYPPDNVWEELLSECY
jgi:hypothetical protein